MVNAFKTRTREADLRESEVSLVSVVSFRTAGAMGRDAVPPLKKTKQNGKDSPKA